MNAAATKDYTRQILSGEGADDYARYMRTDTLLSLQRTPDEQVHRDELLFQVVHQTTELWLKLVTAELAESAGLVRGGQFERAIALVDRATLGMRLVTEQLDMLSHLSPWDFQTIRTVLGHGSGADSPGWRGLARAGRELGVAFLDTVAARGIDLVELHRSGTGRPEHRLAEAMIAWDERVSLWRVRHYKVATRTLGNQTVGTQGTPVEILARLIEYKFFPELWRVRTELTDTGPMGTAP